MKSQVITTPFAGVRMAVSTAVAFDDVLDRLRKVMGHTSLAELVTLAHEPITQVEFVSQVQERFVGESDFMLFAEFDHGGWLSKFDIHRRIVRWVLGTPLIAITMIRHDITVGLFPPVEILIAENLDLEGATITYVRPSSLMLTSENPPLKEAAEKLDAKLDALIASVTSP